MGRNVGGVNSLKDGDGAKDATLRYRSFNREVRGKLSTLTYPEESILNVGLEDLIVCPREDLIAILVPFKGRRRSVDKSKTLLDS